MDKELLTIAEVKAIGNIGRTMVYELIADGTFEAVKVGGATRNTSASVRAWLAGLQRIKPKREDDPLAGKADDADDLDDGSGGDIDEPAKD